jgi:hypothetical protein
MPKSSLWKHVFSATTPITSYVYTNLLPHRFFAYPAAFVRSFLVSAYSQLAFKSPLGHPLRNYLLSDSFFSLLPKDDEQAPSLERELLAKFPKAGGPIPPAGKPSPWARPDSGTHVPQAADRPAPRCDEQDGEAAARPQFRLSPGALPARPGIPRCSGCPES